jgi:hypothetical protein
MAAMKIAICTPAYLSVTGHYALSLARMINWTLREAEIVVDGARVIPDLQLFMRQGSLLPRTRNSLARDAVTWGADYLLWVDADMSFPERALLRLLSHNLPIVGVNYPRRTFPTAPSARDLDEKLVWTTEADAEAGSVVPVEMIGLGLCLVRMDVIRTLRGNNEVPLFSTEYWGEGIEGGCGEDVFFFNRARKAGYAVHLDHWLSWQVFHVHETLLGNADAVAQRALFEASGNG